MYTRLSIIFLLLLPYSLIAQGTRLLREPAVSDKSIVFEYANDLWTVDRSGGEARRLTSFVGTESAPHFSPGGELLAFTGTYAGNSDVYLMDARGGEPKRLTWHPAYEAVCGWSPDGKQILIASNRAGTPVGLPQLWSLSADGGLPVPLHVPNALRASYSADGRHLAFESLRWQAEWKWYRGGQAAPIRIVSLPDLEETEVPGPVSVNTHPVYLGNTLYFLSDRNGTFNVFAYDAGSERVRQLTDYDEVDVKSLAGGGGILVYEQAGTLHSLDPADGADKELTITVHGDFPWAMPHWKDVKKNVATASLSPSGARALFEARGEVFTVPAEKGDMRNLTRSPGAADRNPAWSSDGKKIAWFSDRNGEYALMISDQNGLFPPKEIKLEHPTFYFDLSWSPDSKYVAFTDADRNLWVVDVEKGTSRRLDTDRMAHPERTMVPVWSPDSKWIAYAKQLPNLFRGIMVYSLEGGKSLQITDGLSDAVSPAWDRSGKYLYFLASTDFGLNSGWLDLGSLERPVRRGVYFAVLSKDDPSPLLPESDEEKPALQPERKDSSKKAEKSADSVAVRIDIAGIAHRILALPMPLRNYVSTHPGKAGILFVAEADLPFYPEQTYNPPLTIHRWEMEKRKATSFLSKIERFAVSLNGEKVLYRHGDDWFISGAGSEPKAGDGKLKVELKMRTDPAAEWNQIYREAWRLTRDFFYARNYHGADWNAVYDKYAAYLPYVMHRQDLNYLLDLMGGELAVGHHFVFGGDLGDIESVPVGLLGADLAVENDLFRIKRIYTGENWNPNLQAPLAAPGVDVHEGDYIISINGIDLKPPIPPEAALEGLAGKQVTLAVNSIPSKVGARNVTVVPVPSESGLRRRAWVEDNRRFVDSLSGGKLAYVWLPNTAQAGYEYFNRYYFGQQDKQGVVLDERFNGGGLIADYIIDIVGRKLRGYFNNPVGNHDPWTEPLAGIWGPKVMLINEYAGSGGDMMPYMFRQGELGPLIGRKTWGGLVGIWDYPSLIDGGVVTVPRGGFYNLNGEWEVENQGIAPDIEVAMTPKDAASGKDPQLERAVTEALRLLKENPVRIMKEPKPPLREAPEVE